MYDSKKEARRAYALDVLVMCGRISQLERQKRFILQEGYINNKGEKILPIAYVADFVYYDHDKRCFIVEDVKSPATRTDVYKLKKKIFEYKYPEYMFLES
jgi:hypothetical protein